MYCDCFLLFFFTYERKGVKNLRLTNWDEGKLKELVDLWNKELGKHYPMREELFKQNSFDDKNIYLSGSAIALDNDNKIIGFVVSKKWNEDNCPVQLSNRVGWIQILLVATGHRNQGIGQKLLEHAEKALAVAGVQEIVLGRDPWHYFPGIPSECKATNPWFEKQGYINNGNDYDLISHYSKELTSQMPIKDKVDFTLLKETEKDELLSFLHRCFPGRWEYEALHYFNKGGTGREFVVLKKNNRIIGFCRVNDPESPFIAQNVYWSPLLNRALGGIGPLGVDSAERKKGYGIAIVEAGIAVLRSRGINDIVIDWTGLVDFYGKLGYTKWKSYAKYSKSLD